MNEAANDFKGRTKLAACFDEILEVIQPAWGEKHRLDALASPRLPDLNCDPVSFQNAVLSLLLNAREAMPDGGIIYLRAERSRTNDAQSAIELRVSDAGAGATRAMIAADYAPTPKQRSIGMKESGLPLLDRFVFGAGAHLAVERCCASGATFVLRLPVASR